MASSRLSPTAVNHHHNRNSPILTATNPHLPSINSLPFCNISTSKITSSSQRSYQLPSRNSNLWRGRCGATPPESGPPPGDEQDSSSGSIVSLSRLQESAQIFFAVFFWMSLFFWSSVWDGRNNGKSDKGPRFWK
ncbi:uncharacterized protein [Rutidosis leptorrhynchoides]|uniref:uncharacterized protein n=1 Tax=Rutidosis leptorrhynchoides TaxID=125765 RepID=UPI003A9A3601